MAEMKDLVGKVITEEAFRDAIHVAIFPAIASENLWPGCKVNLVHGTKDQIRNTRGLPFIGVVDPFLTTFVKKGRRCFVFLCPNTVTGMRHEWTLPAIDDQKRPKNESEIWLRKFSEKWNFNYGEMIKSAQEKKGYVIAYGIDIHGASELDAGEENLFWHHIEILANKRFNKEHRSKFTWSCGC